MEDVDALLRVQSGLSMTSTTYWCHSPFRSTWSRLR